MIYLRKFKSQYTAANQPRLILQRELKHFLREWFNLMAVWLARWIKEHEAEITEHSKENER